MYIGWERTRSGIWPPFAESGPVLDMRNIRSCGLPPSPRGLFASRSEEWDLVKMGGVLVDHAP